MRAVPLSLSRAFISTGDGRQYAVAGNIGLGSEATWANLSLEYGGSDPTIRSGTTR